MDPNQNNPAPRRSVPIIPVDEVVVEKKVDAEVTELFNDKPTTPVVPNFDDFIAKTARTKIAIVVPMFGYWGDMENNFLDEDVLDAAMERARSYAHSAYIILLAEPQRLPPWAAKTINTKYMAGNVRGIAMPVGSSYGDYLRKGMEVALNETDASFFVFHSPWTVIQDHGVDSLIDRINIPDNAPVICGYEMHDQISPEAFLRYTTSTPMEKRYLSFNFFGVNRYIAEMCPLDPGMKTQAYLERDFFQMVAHKGYSAVSSESVPMFSFDVPWDGIVEKGEVKQRPYINPADYAADLAAFISKWKFGPEDLQEEIKKRIEQSNG